MANPVETIETERVRRHWVNRVGLGWTISDLVMEPLGQRVSGYIARPVDPVGGLLDKSDGKEAPYVGKLACPAPKGAYLWKP